MDKLTTMSDKELERIQAMDQLREKRIRGEMTRIENQKILVLIMKTRFLMQFSEYKELSDGFRCSSGQPVASLLAGCRPEAHS